MVPLSKVAPQQLAASPAPGRLTSDPTPVLLNTSSSSVQDPDLPLTPWAPPPHQKLLWQVCYLFTQSASPQRAATLAVRTGRAVGEAGLVKCQVNHQGWILDLPETTDRRGGLGWVGWWLIVMVSNAQHGSPSEFSCQIPPYMAFSLWSTFQACK